MGLLPRSAPFLTAQLPLNLSQSLTASLIRAVHVCRMCVRSQQQHCLLVQQRFAVQNLRLAAGSWTYGPALPRFSLPSCPSISLSLSLYD